MLLELEIENLAVIEKQNISFSEKLNVITGDTGAGKSVILKAIELVLGGRASTDLIRSGSDELRVQAIFDISKLDKNKFPDFIESDELIISRSINAAGRNKVYINGSLFNVNALGTVASVLADVCRQGEYIELLNSDSHLDILDAYGSLAGKLTKYFQAYQKWRALQKEYHELQGNFLHAETRIEELRNSIAELEAIKPEPDLREKLSQKVKSFVNMDALLQIRSGIDQALNGEEGLFSCLQHITKLNKELERVGNLPEVLEEAFNILNNSADDFEKACADLDVDQDINPEEIKATEEHLAEVARLQRKYAVDDEGLAELLEQNKFELEKITQFESPEKFKVKVEHALTEVKKLATEISKVRKERALKLEKAVCQELIELNLPKTVFICQFLEKEYSANGQDELEFLISTNPGESPKALKKISSGGELSRILLAFKVILNESYGVNTIIFDEIDVGVSGATASLVGKKLKLIAGSSQVICVTHLPQVAVFADLHLLVKKDTGERTYSAVTSLSQELRVEEVARLISGQKITDDARATAKGLLEFTP